MPRNQIVKRARTNRIIRPRSAAQLAAARAIHNGLRRLGKLARNQALRHRVLDTSYWRDRQRQRILYSKSRPGRKYVRITGNAAGTTHTTTRMIVRKTPKDQRFLRKLFREGESSQVKYVQRFGFSFIGAERNNETIWYSITHNKLNNIHEFLGKKVNSAMQTVGDYAYALNQAEKAGNTPDQFIYLGKCTFSYEIYNPTNYNMTVYIYDLICKHDTPRPINYGSTQTLGTSNSPEVCMQQGFDTLQLPAPGGGWTVADPTKEVENGDAQVHTDPDWRTVGMKPTDSYYFNTMWKVKGLKKIVLPPCTTHHHIVVFNPKAKISLGNLLFRNANKLSSDKNGVAGITQSTLFGIEGQVATERLQTSDNEKVGTLPGKIVIKCVRKCNVWNFAQKTKIIIQKNNLMTLQNPEIWSDLQQRPAEDI